MFNVVGLLHGVGGNLGLLNGVHESGNVNGCQVGLINYTTDKTNGYQIGLINYAPEGVFGGAQIGLLNF